jgi:zinc transport system substrate-binding protein
MPAVIYMKKILFSVLLIGAAGAVLGVLLMRTAPDSFLANEKVSVATSFYPLYFFAQKIGGDKADVFAVTPAGTEPHDYEPSPQDILRIEKSAMLIVLGTIEPWAENVTGNISNKNIVIVKAGADIIKEDDADAHVWLNPVLAQRLVDVIAAGFLQADPENSGFYTGRANAMKEELRVLDQEYVRGLEHCSQKNIVVSHAAFGHLASAYGLTQVPVYGLSPDFEPSARELAQVARFAKEHDVQYIFFESLVSPRLSETIAQEIGVRTLALNPLEGLTSQEIAEGEDYFTHMRTNLANLRKALQCP